ncbi:hypothetical protein HanLR1_Chr05g0163071 [Helianthus annuus]|nr:hypothetical protein HanLR1_Chr05g0163071 [Helianthus annuus]
MPTLYVTSYPNISLITILLRIANYRRIEKTYMGVPQNTIGRMNSSLKACFLSTTTTHPITCLG